MTEMTIAIPETCPDHPANGTIHLSSTEIYLLSGNKVTLREYSCSVDSCHRPLTWEFQCTKQGVRLNGAGPCHDQRVLDAMACARHDQRTDFTIRVGGVATTLLLVAAAHTTLQLVDGWRVAIYAGYVAAGLTTALGYLINRARVRPPWPKFSD